MFGFSSPPARPGRPLLARSVNRPAESIARRSRSRPGGALAAIEAAGTPLSYATSRRTWTIRITSVGSASDQLGQYGWQAIYGDPDDPGSYVDLPGWSGALGEDAFFEDNTNSNLAVNDRVEVRREYYTGRVCAQFAHC